MPRPQSQLLISLALAATTPVFGCRAEVVVRRGPPVVASEAPTIRLAESTNHSPSPASHSTTGFASLSSASPELIFVDLRPDIERKYYPGSTRLTQWRDAVTIRSATISASQAK